MLLAEAGQLKIGDVVYSTIAGRGSNLCTIIRLRNGSAGVKIKGSALSNDPPNFFWIICINAPESLQSTLSSYKGCGARLRRGALTPT
jgi:hypothetical protein